MRNAKLRAGWLKNDVVAAALRAQELRRPAIVASENQMPIVIRGLPMPPSVNALFANTSRKKTDDVAAALSHVGLAPTKKMRGRKITARYAAWIQLAGYRLNLAAQTPLVGRVTVLLELDEDAVADADADNFAKAPLDLLVKQGLIEDDNKKIVREVTTRWKCGGGLNIIVSPCTN